MADPRSQIGGELRRLTDYPEHLQLIGLIVTDWSSLEMRLGLLLWPLVGNIQAASAIYHSLDSTKSRLDVVRGLAAQVLEGKQLAEAKECFKQIDALTTKRNQVAHHQWGRPAKGGPDPFTSHQKPRQGEAAVEEHIWSVDELRQLADKICEVEQRIARLTFQLEFPGGIPEWVQNLRQAE